jgi:putative membrane protein
MIRAYSDHAANERTFLAWVRTGIAVIARGLVIEKFNLFLLMIATASLPESAERLRRAAVSGPFGRYGGFVLCLIGVVVIAIAAVRFVRTHWLLDDQETHSGSSVRVEVILAAILALVVAIGSTVLVLD